MLLVAVAGVVLGTGIMLRRAFAYQQVARLYAIKEGEHRALMGFYTAQSKDWAAKGDEHTATGYLAEARHYRMQAEHWAALRRKYERAVRCPWLQVRPDPPQVICHPPG